MLKRFGVLALLSLVISPLALACSSSSASGPTVPSYPVGTAADSGFRPAQNGLPFENYGGSLSDGVVPTNMTAADVQKMFGDAVCADPKSRTCDLIPEAQDWLNSTNEAMAGGHCYGFSVVSDLLWQGKLTSASFGASSVGGLDIYDNQSLQRTIAYDWALQTLESVQAERVTGTPNKILLTLLSALKPHAPQAYTIVFWKRDGTGGHAVTPYAVQSKGDGKFDVLIYDNNWPGQTRAMSFDTKTNSWSYNAATNPNETDSLYEGDAGTKTLALDPASPGLGQQHCPFCGKVPATTSAAGGSTNTEQVSLYGTPGNDADLIIADDAGRKLGYIHGALVDQIHGGQSDPLISNQDWTNKAQPDLFVPADQKYTITLDGSTLRRPDNETVNIVGPSYDLAIKNIMMKPGDKDTLVVEPDATHITYTTSRLESPTIDLGVSDTSADYAFELTGVSDRPGSSLNLVLPAEGGSLSVQPVGAGTSSSISFKMTRETDQGAQVFQHQSIPIPVGDAIGFQFAQWSNAGAGMPVTTTHGGETSTQTVTNQATT